MELFTLIKSSNKKAQAWSLDVVIATIIFVVGLALLYFYAINYASHSQGDLEQMFYEGQLASELILSEDDFGILTEDKVNQTKLNEYLVSYDAKKAVLGVRSDFYFDFGGITYGRVNSTEIENLVKITRVTIYEDKPTKLELFVWRNDD